MIPGGTWALARLGGPSDPLPATATVTPKDLEEPAKDPPDGSGEGRTPSKGWRPGSKTVQCSSPEEQIQGQWSNKGSNKTLRFF